MLSLLIIFFVAGVSYGQPSQYGDCTTEQTIIDQCSSHLDYLNNIDGAMYVGNMKKVGQITDPTFLLVPKMQLDKVCNDTAHLKMYFSCVFANLTTCLQDANSSQAMGVPDSDKISEGIVAMCNSRGDLNVTCILTMKSKVEECFDNFMQKQRSTTDICLKQDEMLACANELNECGGADAVKDYLMSTTPRKCSDVGGAVQRLAALSTIFGGLLLTLLINSL